MKAALSIDSTWPCSVSEAEEAIFFKLPRIENDFFLILWKRTSKKISNTPEIYSDCGGNRFPLCLLHTGLICWCENVKIFVYPLLFFSQKTVLFAFENSQMSIIESFK
ncbi:hypothetical protein CEXT_760261 [Caerostris extrusa]|uniref:Uncharacterized protein n=1 Tax=Caerostris extrusa TaxID=172846 RepID=A0AAV4RB46_CAEEX|nr:hypothetical protein CEXT_760261 [Caerostris extrusa]